jgi:hypothetical protein
LEDCKDTQYWGSEFHYSWLLILIALVGWKEPTYNVFLQRTRKFGASRYMSIQITIDTNENKINSDVFSLYLTNIQSMLEDTWHMENFPRKCPGVWTDRRFPSIAP